MAKKKPKNYGDHCYINGMRIDLAEHETDFTVNSPIARLQPALDSSEVTLEPLSDVQVRATARTKSKLGAVMRQVRENHVAHHVYVNPDTDQEIVIDDKLFLRATDSVVNQIKEDHHLVDAGMMGDTRIMRVTGATGRNPVKTANMINERDDVEYCSPQLMVQPQRHQASLAAGSVLFREQWYLTADLNSHPDIDPRSDIQAPETWQVSMGDPSIVIAVMDDGIDTGHPAFAGKPFDPNGRNFADNHPEPTPDAGDFHGTPVASIAAGSQGTAMIGVAPQCTILPIRIGFGPLNQVQTLSEFKHASRHCDVLNCSFGFPPLDFQIFDPGFVQEIKKLTETGGRRGKGLVIVFSAGNDDAPTELTSAENKNGVRFLGKNNAGNFVVREIPKNRAVFSAYPSIPGSIVVAAMSSLGRKSGYSNWGRQITMTAPSSNGHELSRIDNDFRANYRGQGQISASNRPGHGTSSRPLRDNPFTPSVREDFYTDDFGGTSGAAPVVSGVAALMLSVNPDLSADEVRGILMATSDRDLDSTTDLANDPNLQGFTGGFSAGRSEFFGSGKVNALNAVNRAKALRTSSANRKATAVANLAIPDNHPQGVVSQVNIPSPGPVRSIVVDVDISHTYRGDLSVVLVSPQGFTAQLHRVREGGPADDLKRRYSAENNQDLADLVDAMIEGGGPWRLHVADRLRRDVGTLNHWTLDLTGTRGPGAFA